MHKYTFCFLLLSMLLFDCKKEAASNTKELPSNPIKPSVPSTPSILTVTPLQGKLGDTIVINGSNFSDTMTRNKLTMRGIEASIIEATVSTLKAIVPDMVSNGPVKVSVNGKEAVGPDFTFLVLPKIESLLPATGQQGDTITIMGAYFGADTSANKVTMNGVDAKVVSGNANTLRVLVPDMRTPGAVQVKTAVGLSNNASFSFFVPPAPVINSIAPLTITQGDTITISGANFNPTAAGNTLTINGSSMKIVKAAPTFLQYVFEYPALHGNVSFNFQLATNGGTVARNDNFKVYDVYVMGNDLNRFDIWNAKYWKNGQQIMLSDEKKGSWAKSIAVLNSDVYVGGAYTPQAPLLPPGFTRDIAQYWKNGIAYALITDTTSYINNVSNQGQVGFHGMFAENNNLHILYMEVFQNGQYSYHVNYWKNGIVKVLQGSGCDGIYVSGNDIYRLDRDGYWKNEIYYPVGDGAEALSAMCVSGNDIYISAVKTIASFHQIVRYYKNGVLERTLTDGTSSANARCIYVSGNDVYVGGWDGDPAVYWKNGIKYILNTWGSVNDIKMIDGNLYMCGSEGGSAKYWKNGVGKTLPAIAGASQSLAGEIFLY
ncbi:IPT/TIG domain-containing protein [Niabella drilacis]|uniref:IPT/TIG domain-containing protein n=1 Tax=Niabella drilacis (strain DSM 25811 / CCM 8410 / CCUG 62505 / LMG 26954 / E90) TaxID=1285928 RepID=A0A1G6RZB4_NIADE|nr:IPT/TIG domain-containing protein [Niabella drilacis]SDD10000.1 IPT/TIG domain-containing protein [Niabella drilacis]